MNRRRAAAIAAILFAASQPIVASAHHAMDNALPSTAWQGLLSGLGHPVIGLDHFVFVVAMGAAGYFFGRHVTSIAAFLVAALAGTIAHVQLATVPHVELWVAASLVALGVVMLRAAPLLRSAAAPAFFTLAGLFHGYAYGESIVGAEPAPLGAYLVGFTLAQAAIALGGFVLARHADRTRRSQLALRTLGTAASVTGIAFLMLAITA